ncbi:DUF4270 family protein [Sphingobacterium bovistauri]|uniref:DUF4270 family protein n=1 Tax=Sphingobacterium bovistauri TaxID=2781959 RepID=A0ABS7ZAE4_9SPHI|nr:DUF4270 family protein [Sphingobacterium bovistauri]MCA5005684.1 DUF4270 family protein [Sphingobacterium bovistauri]
MSQILRFKYIHIFSIIYVLSLFTSCNKDTSISLDHIDEDIAVTFIDSFSVNTSTYQLNYLPSLGTKAVLVGKVQTPDLGTIKSSSYLKVLLDSYTDNIPQDAIFDSVNVVLRPNAARYYFGDTTQTQTLKIHKVTQEIVTTNLLTAIDSYNAPVYVTGPTVFSNQKFNYDTSALGTVTFKPNVNSIDSINIKLNDNFGRDIFDKINSNDFNVSNANAFLTYLKGIAIVPDDNNTVVLGLKDTVQININYSYVGPNGFRVTGKKVMSSALSNFSYNNIEYNRAGTSFAALNQNNRELSFSQTDNKAYIQSGTGIATKIKIPALSEFMSATNISINKAELIIETESLNYGNNAAPSGLMLMVTNKNGLPINYIPTPMSTTIQQASYMSGTDIVGNGKYVFNLIDYIKNINTNRYIDTDLLISTIAPSIFSTVNTAKIANENGKPKIKLNIVYTKFK